MKITFKGLSEIQKAIPQTPKAKEAMRAVVKYHSAELGKKCADKVPVARVNGGTLKRSHIQSIQDDGMTGSVKATARYAGYVHQGTRYMAARPWMKNSLDEVLPQFRKDMNRILEATK